MPIIRTQNQSTDSLEEFYNHLDQKDEVWKIVKSNMLNLLNSLNEEYPDTTFYALTSHARLIILENKETFSNHLVTFSSSLHTPNEYFIDAMLPDSKSIWKNSRITTTVNGIENAIECFKLALKNLELTNDK